MSRVVKAITRGSFNDGRIQNAIYYILFELADSDLRKYLDLDNKLSFAAQLRVLQQATVGLKQLHWADIAHQDIKPSNTLLYKEFGAKIGDLGHAHDKRNLRPGLDELIAGDPSNSFVNESSGEDSHPATRNTVINIIIMMVSFLNTPSSSPVRKYQFLANILRIVFSAAKWAF